MQDFIIIKQGDNWVNTAAWKAHLNGLSAGRYLVSIKSTKQRSTQQNAYYWGVVLPLVYEGLKAAGFESVRNNEDVHLITASLFLKVAEEKNGVKIEKIISTTELSTVGFMEYLQNITIWAFDYLGIKIPEPNEQLNFDL